MAPVGGVNGGPPGDLYVLVRIREHEIFVREGADLYCDLPVGFAQLALGAEVQVPVLNGTAELRIPPGSQPNQILKLKGKGLPHLRQRGHGDHGYRLILEVPPKLNAKQREALLAYDAASKGERGPLAQAFLERMKKLGMAAQLHSRPLIQGVLMHKVHGDKAWDMPPFRRVQDSGIHWGLGSDATAVTTSNPFYTLSLAVTGRMIGGYLVNRQSIAREEALIAHTRSNAYFLFLESNLGSLSPGKYADLLVLDRDYLTVPVDEIKDIRPLMTMVGGRIVYDAMAK